MGHSICDDEIINCLLYYLYWWKVEKYWSSNKIAVFVASSQMSVSFKKNGEIPVLTF